MDEDSQSKGPFDRILHAEPGEQSDRTALYVVAGLVVVVATLLILVFPLAVFDDDDNEQPSNVSVSPSEDVPPLPDGYEAVSGLLDLSDQPGGPPLASPRVIVPLSAGAEEGEELPVYTYSDGDWEQLGTATVLGGGTSAQADLEVLPDNIAVLRQTESAGLEVLGSLPAGAQPDPAALDAVTTINARGFTPAADGSIVGDTALLAPLQSESVAPTIAAVLPAEVQALDQILASPELSAVHVAAIFSFATETGAGGVDLDYKTVAPERADAFTAFVRSLSEELHGAGKTLTISLPAPVLSGDEWSTAGYQWEVLVPLVDGVKIAPPNDPAQYFVVMEGALDYLVPRVGGARLLLTVGPLSREQSVDGVRPITLDSALALASVPATSAGGAVEPGASLNVFGQNLSSDTGASGLRWDDAARSVTFTYAGAGGQRTVWISNGFSEAFKMDVAREYGLGGISVDSIGAGSASANIWPRVREFVEGSELALITPNQDILQPGWEVSAGELDSQSGPTVVWTLPQEPGTYNVTLVVSDGSVRAGQRLTVTVGAAASSP
jgi:hypothetical protein